MTPLAVYGLVSIRRFSPAELDAASTLGPRAVLQGLSHVGHADPVGLVEIGYRARHLQDPMEAPSRKLLPVMRVSE